ncbi:MAG: hypothetical protein JSR33_07585 [Proteobacteria bacterium]|nr:hypothetical protein [Pseudomonadota bacterium]
MSKSGLFVFEAVKNKQEEKEPSSLKKLDQSKRDSRQIKWILPSELKKINHDDVDSGDETEVEDTAGYESPSLT